MDSQTPIEADTSESVSESGSSDADNESEYTTEDKSSESESENWIISTDLSMSEKGLGRQGILPEEIVN